MTWRIVFSNGDEELTDERVDKLTTGVSGDMLYAFQKMTYGPDELIATYPICNVRKWEKVKK
jgi:hypothetical protein